MFWLSSGAQDEQTEPKAESSTSEECCIEDCAQEFETCQTVVHHTTMYEDEAESTQEVYIIQNDEVEEVKEDSCEAVADERSSITDSDELCEGDLQMRFDSTCKLQKRWDYFPSSDEDQKEEESKDANKTIELQGNYFRHPSYRSIKVDINSIQMSSEERKTNTTLSRNMSNFAADNQKLLLPQTANQNKRR